MRRVVGTVLGLALIGCSTPTESPQPASAAQAASSGPTRDAQGGIVLPPGQDMSKLTSAAPEPPGPGTQLGPYAPVTIAAAEELSTHTVYYPTDLSAFPAKGKLPVLVWGNGACRNEG